MKIVIGVNAGGLTLNRYALTELFNRIPEAFDAFYHIDFLFSEDSHLTGADAQKRLLECYPGTVVDTEKIHFVSDHAAIRANPWLIEQVERDPVRVIDLKRLDGVKVCDIPDDIQWYIREDDDGSESIHEVHRVWR